MRKWLIVIVIAIAAALAYYVMRGRADKPKPAPTELGRATGVAGVGSASAPIGSAAPTAAPSAPSVPSLTTDAGGPAPPLRTFKAQLRERLADIENAVRECATKHVAKKLSGRAMLFVIAGRDKKRAVSIETTGIVDDESTVHDEALLTCFHEAGRGMGPIELDDAIDSALIHWRVELVNGEITEIHSSDYSFRKDTDGPFD